MWLCRTWVPSTHTLTLYARQLCLLTRDPISKSVAVIVDSGGDDDGGDCSKKEEQEKISQVMVRNCMDRILLAYKTQHSGIRELEM